MNKRHGFSLIELLIVVAVLGILAALILTGVAKGRLKAHDTAIRSDVGQLRWQAEILYDSNGATFQDWATSPPANVAQQLQILRDDIDTHLGDTDGTTFRSTIIDTQRKEYCISAPLRSDPTQNYCVDATAIFKTVSTPCQPASGSIPVRCPAS